jgi:hypothetical protein
MALELASRRKLSELMTDHVLGYENWDVGLAVVDGNGATDHLWRDGRLASPGLDNGTIFEGEGLNLLF